MSSLSDAAHRPTQLELTPPEPRLVLPRLSVSYRSLVSIGLPALLFATVLSVLAFNALTRVSLESDSAMHVLFMKVIADTLRLPTHIPHFAARVAAGGIVEAWFPYQYTPLYHIVGAAFYKAGGTTAVLFLGPLCGAVLAVLLFRLAHPSVAWPFAILAIALAFASRHTWPVFTWVFMEPLVIVLFIGGLLFYRRVWTGKDSARNAALAGLFIGAAIAARQTALMYACFLFLHAIGSLIWRHRRELPGLRRSLHNLAVMAATTAAVAAPALLYLFWRTGDIGYGPLGLPGLQPQLPIDPAANSYISSITTPDIPILEWADRFRRTLLYMSPWQPWYIASLPLVLFAMGIGKLLVAGRPEGRFLASYVPLHLLGECAIFVLLHGNPRYVMLSRMLFFVVVAIGLSVVWSWLRREVSALRLRPRLRPILVPLISAAILAALTPAFFSPGFIRDAFSLNDSRGARAQAYSELGDWIQTNTPADSLILSGRWYAPGLYFDRDYTWVTYYGNIWAVEASQATDPEASADILAKYGVDYVIVQNPPGTYADRMPRDGLRTTLLEDQEHFNLVFRNDRTRLYQFFPDGQASEADYATR